MTVVEFQTCSNWNATEAPKLLSIFLFIYCIHIHTVTDVGVDIHLHPYTHTHIRKNFMRASKTEILYVSSH